jgi:competence ComEA-like helix-hairpin-helix protein
MVAVLPSSPLKTSIEQKESTIVVDVDSNQFICFDCNPLIFGFKLDLNNSSIEELVHLPMIGPKRAKSIMEYKRASGQIKSVEDLIAIRGIGPATVKRISPYITVQ